MLLDGDVEATLVASRRKPFGWPSGRMVPEFPGQCRAGTGPQPVALVRAWPSRDSLGELDSLGFCAQCSEDGNEDCDRAHDRRKCQAIVAGKMHRKTYLKRCIDRSKEMAELIHDAGESAPGDRRR
jgi:hypothetical protein